MHSRETKQANYKHVDSTAFILVVSSVVTNLGVFLCFDSRVIVYFGVKQYTIIYFGHWPDLKITYNVSFTTNDYRHCSYYWYCLISWQATNVNFILFGLFRPGIELVIQIYDSNYNRHSGQTLGNRPCKFRECPENYLHTKQKVDFIGFRIIPHSGSDCRLIEKILYKSNLACWSSIKRTSSTSCQKSSLNS
jgi:hypothetical protein